MRNAITVGISSFREEYFNWVAELLQSLEKQTVKDFEVVLAISRNRNYFTKILDALKRNIKTSYRIDVLFNPVDKGIAHSRNIILKHAETRYVAYTDADAIPHSRWIEEILHGFQMKPMAAAICGPVVGLWKRGLDGISLWFPKELYWIIGCTPWTIKEMTTVRNGFASNFAFKRDVLLELGGFAESFGYNPRDPIAGEEPEIGVRLMRKGYSTFWNPKAVVFHRITRERLRVRNLLARSILEGKTKARLKKLYGGKALDAERKHILSILKHLATAKSLRSRALVLISTIAVFISYARFCLSRDESL